MRVRFAFAAVAALTAQASWACPPPPPGYVPPTEEQLLERSLTNVTDIVYGVVVPGGVPEKSSNFKIIHVYRGSLRQGEVIEADAGWGHPAPFCLGMMSAAYPRPVGSYGVVAFRDGRRELNFISPDHVRMMIGKGWIKSAQAR